MKNKGLFYLKNHFLLSGFAGILIVILFLSGCANQLAQKRIVAFSTALSIATTNTTDAFEIVDQKYYQTKVALLVVNYDTKGFKPDTEMHFLPGEDLAVREKVFEALHQYAQKLADIMSDKQLKDFDAETKAFGTSLHKLNDNPAFKEITGGVSETGINAFVTAVNTIGSFFVEYKRQKGVREIVTDMKKPIEDICDTLISDIGQPDDVSGKGGHGLRAQAQLQYKEMLKSQDSFILQNKEKFDARTKAEEIAKLPAIFEEGQKVDLTLKSTRETLEKLKKTHNELVKAFDEECPTLENLISELIIEGKRVREFYRSLEKK